MGKSWAVASQKKRISTIIDFRIVHKKYQYSRTPFIRIKWDGEPSGYAENPVIGIFI
jgi:hypothetical protein